MNRWTTSPPPATSTKCCWFTSVLSARGFTTSPVPTAITVAAGEIANLATKAEAALVASGMPVFQRGYTLVRPAKQEVIASGGRTTVAAGLREVSVPAMIDVLAKAACWQRRSARAGVMVPCDPPALVAKIILSRAGHWTLPVVAGVVTTPTLRPDGSLPSAPGYDPVTRLFHIHDGELTMSLASSPTRPEAEAALMLLNGLLDNFPFVAPLDRAVALSGLITPVARGAMSVAPLHAIRSSTAGTGKSYFVDLASAISTGRPCPVVAAGRTEEETEKRLGALILGGYSLISIDNVSGPLGGDLLCQMVERPLVRLRPLGKSEIVEVESRSTMFANGNALAVRGDMTRRSLISNLDAKMERPETRTFPFDPMDRILADRGRYVAAALTIVRAYLHAGKPDLLRPIASYREWSDLVRSPLVWLGWPDPVESMEVARDDDPDLRELRELLTLWKDALGTNIGFTAREIVDHAESQQATEPDLRDALVRIAGQRGLIDNKRLGDWLRMQAGRIVGGLAIRRDGTAHGGVARWKVTDGTGGAGGSVSP